MCHFFHFLEFRVNLIFVTSFYRCSEESLSFFCKVYLSQHPSWQSVLHTSQILATIKKGRTDFQHKSPL